MLRGKKQLWSQICFLWHCLEICNFSAVFCIKWCHNSHSTQQFFQIEVGLAKHYSGTIKYPHNYASVIEIRKLESKHLTYAIFRQAHKNILNFNSETDFTKIICFMNKPSILNLMYGIFSHSPHIFLDRFINLGEPQYARLLSSVFCRCSKWS